MIEIILYWILSKVDTPTFIWVVYWIHILGVVLRLLGSILKSVNQ